MSIPETNGTGVAGGAAPETETQAEPSAPQTPEELMQAASARIAALEAEREDFRDRWMRAEAETANVRARGRREVEETRQFAVQKFARDIAEAAETLRRGLDSIPSGTGGEGEHTVEHQREGARASWHRASR